MSDNELPLSYAIEIHGAKLAAIVQKDGWDDVVVPGAVSCGSYCYGGTSTIEGDKYDADAELIVAARNALPELLADLRRERERNAELENQLRARIDAKAFAVDYVPAEQLRRERERNAELATALTRMESERCEIEVRLHDVARDLYAAEVNQQGIGRTDDNAARIRKCQHELVSILAGEHYRARWMKSYYELRTANAELVEALRPFAEAARNNGLGALCPTGIPKEQWYAAAEVLRKHGGEEK